LNPPEADASQTSLSLEDAIEATETTAAEDLTNIEQEMPDAAKGQHHD
jgi:hypothetical protein